MIKADIDIDVGDRNSIVENITNIPASSIKNGEITKHISGVYFQNVPVDPETGFCSIDYKKAENFGFIKFDFLNNSIYKEVRDMNHLLELESREPIWELLEYKEFVNELQHLRNHFDIVQKIKPKNIHELAIVLALIRPGKMKLLSLSKEEIKKKIWIKDDSEGFTYKKSHSYAYAKMIIIQMNLLVEKYSS